MLFQVQLVPPQLEQRRREREQARYAAADDGEGVGIGGLKKGAEKLNVAETASAKVRLWRLHHIIIIECLFYYLLPLTLYPNH